MTGFYNAPQNREGGGEGVQWDEEGLNGKEWDGEGWDGEG